MTVTTDTPTRYRICLGPECEVFAVRATDRRDDDDVLVDRTWEPVGPGPDVGPQQCLTALVAEGDLPDDVHLGRWHPTPDDAAIVGYWTITTG